MMSLANEKGRTEKRPERAGSHWKSLRLIEQLPAIRPVLRAYYTCCRRAIPRCLGLLRAIFPLIEQVVQKPDRRSQHRPP
jgi:hypothetical protein